MPTADRPEFPAELRAWFRAQAALRQRFDSLCAHCGIAIRGVNSRRYCSNACRQRAKRQRQGAVPRATP